MADEQYRWLDRDAAERLLRGEPLAKPSTPSRPATRPNGSPRAALERPGRADPRRAPELPGEDAAVAAFRTARGGSRTARAVSAGPDGRSRDEPTRRRGPRPHRRPPPRAGRAAWPRPARSGWSPRWPAAMLGGVAVAAGRGAGAVRRRRTGHPARRRRRRRRRTARCLAVADGAPGDGHARGDATPAARRHRRGDGTGGDGKSRRHDPGPRRDRRAVRGEVAGVTCLP